MTKARKATLQVLQKATVPLCAQEIIGMLDALCNPVTVYRTLHYFETHKEVDSFVLHCTAHGTERYYVANTTTEGDPKGHRHWFHCEECHQFTDFGECTLESLVSQYEEAHQVSVRSHTLYFTGICTKCRDVMKSPV